MKKVIALLLAALMVCSLAACDMGGTGMEELCGQWELELVQETETAKTVLQNQEFYDEELALVDLDTLICIMVVEFNEDKTYSYYIDSEATKVSVRTFYEGVMDDLFEGRAALDAVYEQELSAMTREEFDAFYSELFGFDSVDALLDAFVEYSFDYDILGETMESGTFRIRLGDIIKKPDGKTEEESMGFKIEGTTLTLTYSDGDEVYQKR